jgi:hypothetical protein
MEGEKGKWNKRGLSKLKLDRWKREIRKTNF